MRLHWFVLIVAAGCHEPKVRKVGNADTVAAEPAQPAHGAGRDRWRGGGFYVDGTAIGMLRYAELPRGVAPTWELQRHRLPFRAGEPVRYRESRAPRYRVTDYLAALGVPVGDITAVHFHGGRDAAMVVSGDDLRRHPDDILFRFAADTSGKPIPVVRGVEVNTSFDDLQALAVYVARKPPTLTADQTLELDGDRVSGIPYRGQPLREGIRVYVDDRMAAVLKRNQLDTGATLGLAEVLARAGVATTEAERIELIHGDARTAELPWGEHTVAFNPAASGELVIDGMPASALALYTYRR
jgi:hypothetical protein